MGKPRSRGSGEGSIYRRKDGRYVAALYLGVKIVNDKPQPDIWRTYGKTRSEVRKALDDFKADRAKKKLVGTGEQLLKDYLTDWLKTVETTRRQTTATSYAERINLHVIPALGDLRLDELTPQHVDQMLATMTAAKLSPRTVQYTRAVLRIALNRAIRRQMIDSNAAALAEAPSSKPKAVEPLSIEDAGKMLAAVKGHPLEALFSVALALGLRQGEALGLRWKDVDLEKGELRTVVELVLGEKGVFRLDELKTHKSRRTLPLPQFAVTALRERKVRQLEEQLQSKEWKGNEWGLVFTTAVGTPVNRHNLYREWRRILTVAKLPAARFYDLRHTCASLLFAQGLDERKVMDVLGHSQISLTANTYTHIIRRVRQEAADKMDELFGAPKPEDSDGLVSD